MTKIRNTKKGMAKKTLSISLAVAMLATSNVPVWAAEDLFTDGEVAVEAFTSDEETVVEEEVVEETSVVEEAEAEVATEANLGYTTNLKLKESGNGWAGNLVLNSDVVVTDGTGKTVPVEDYKWTVRKDGEFYADGNFVEQPGSSLVAEYWFVPLGHDDYNHKFDVLLEVDLGGGKTLNLVSNEITVSPVNIGEIAAKNGNSLYFDHYGYDDLAYTGNEIKLVPNKGSDYEDAIINDTESGIKLGYEDFVLTYSGDLVNVTGKPVVVTGKVKLAGTNEADPAYIGGVTGEYTLKKRNLAANLLTAKLKNPDYTYEYCDELATFTADELEVKITNDSLKEIMADSAEDITYAVKKAVAAGLENKGQTPYKQDITVTLDTSKLTNFKWDAEDKTVTATDAFKITARDLSKLTATLNRAYSVTEFADGTVNKLTPADFTFKDANGNVVKLNTNAVSISFDLTNIDLANPVAGTYKNAIIFNEKTGYSKNGPIKTDLTLLSYSLANGKFVNDTYAHAEEEFAGDGVEVKKDVTKLGNFYLGTEVLDSENYVIEYADNTQASSSTKNAKLIVKGVGKFAGTQAVFEFPINRTTIEEVKADKKELLYNPAYTSAADYLKDLALTVTADNKSTESITTDRFTLKDTDYVISNIETLKDTPNELKGANEEFTFAVTVKATTDEAGNPNGNYVDKTADGVTTELITVCKKSLSSEDVKVTVTPNSYVYTGTQIIPDEVIVKDGNTVLEEGTDYEIVEYIHSNDAVDAGTAKITVIAKKDGRYKPGSTATGTFTITPASIEDVKVTYAGAVYNGTKHNSKENVTVKLGDIDVTKDFDITFPYSKTANINAGKTAGKVTLTAKASKAKNYSTATTEATFEIKPAALTGTIELRDEAGRLLTGVQKFAYDGTEHNFAKVKFVPDTNRLTTDMKVTDNDFEVVYADAVYGKAWEKAGNPLGHVFVVAKGNYTGTLTTVGGKYEELAGEGKFVDAAGKEITSIAASQHFEIEQLVVSPSKITVKNGEYAGGYLVKPNVTVKYDGETLVEGKDYELDLSANKNMVDVTAKDTLTVVVKPINGYKMNSNGAAYYTFNWGIDKKDLDDCYVTVTKNGDDFDLKVMNGSVTETKEAFDVVDNGDGTATVSVIDGGKSYTGSVTVDIVDPEDTGVVGKAMIEDVKIDGNKATVVLSGDVENAIGYDYVIATEEDYKNGRVSITKNQLKTTGDFHYVQNGVYYAYCHAWKRDENGKKVFGDWSNLYKFSVTATTPGTPAITEYSVNGNDVTVTYTKAADATGYDVVLGTEYATIAGEKRPVKYGELVKKNINANTVSVTFKDVEPGKYYAGLHAFNRTRTDGKKVFSPWSNIKPITVK